MLPIQVLRMKNGSSEPAVELVDVSASHNAFEPSNATASINVKNDGNINKTEGSFTIFNQTWLNSGNAADYDVKMVPVSGTLSSGTVNTWQNLASNRSFGVTRSGVGIKQFTGILYIKPTSGSVPVAQCNVTLYSEVESFS